MFDITKYFTNGLKNTIMVRNNSGMSYKGPWILLYENTLLDRWHVGDFLAADYTIVTDFDNNNREIVKLSITATLDLASVQIYSRNNTGRDLIDITATVNNSYVDVLISPSIDDSSSIEGAKVYFNANYYHSSNPLVV